MTAAERVVAWLVHLYTAMGLVCAAGMTVLIVRGGDANFRGAFALMISHAVVPVLRKRCGSRLSK